MFWGSNIRLGLYTFIYVLYTFAYTFRTAVSSEWVNPYITM